MLSSQKWFLSFCDQLTLWSFCFSMCVPVIRYYIQPYIQQRIFCVGHRNFRRRNKKAERRTRQVICSCICWSFIVPVLLVCLSCSFQCQHAFFNFWFHFSCCTLSNSLFSKYCLLLSSETTCPTGARCGLSWLVFYISFEQAALIFPLIWFDFKLI